MLVAGERLTEVTAAPAVRTTAPARPTRSTQRWGSRISSRDGSRSGPAQQASTARGPPTRSMWAMKRSPCSYWLSLLSRPISFRSMRTGGEPPWRRAESVEAKRSAARTRPAPARSIVTSPWPSSRAIIPPISFSVARCSGEATRASIPPSSSRRRASARSCMSARAAPASWRASGSATVSARSTRPLKCAAIHGTPVNWARWVSSCKRTQRRNWSRRELEAPLQPDEVGPDQVDDVAARLVAQQEVVLAEHAAAHPPEQRPELDRGHPAGHLAGHAAAAAHPVLPAGEQRAQQASERGDVGRHPGRPVDHLHVGRTGRHQAGRRGDEGLGQRGLGRHVALELGQLAGQRRRPGGQPRSDALGQPPVDQSALRH